jgi:hypothetical protein
MRETTRRSVVRISPHGQLQRPVLMSQWCPGPQYVSFAQPHAPDEPLHVAFGPQSVDAVQLQLPLLHTLPGEHPKLIEHTSSH